MRKFSFLFELTNDCNLNCPHCYYQLNKSKPQEINFEKLRGFFERNKKFIGRVTLTGGEPLKYSKLHRLMKYLYLLGIPFNLNTNGSLLTKEIIRFASTHGLHSVSLSFDAPHFFKRKLLHEGHQKALEGLNLLLSFNKRNFKIRVVSVLAKQNFQQTREIYESFKKLPIDDFCFQPVFIPRTRKKLFKRFSLFDLPNKEKRNFISPLENWAKNMKYQAYLRFWANYLNKEKTTRASCLNVNSFWCDCRGDIYPCFVKLSTKVGDLDSRLDLLYKNEIYQKHIKHAANSSCFTEKCFCAFPNSLKE